MKFLLKENLLTCTFSVIGKNAGAFVSLVSRNGVRVLKVKKNEDTERRFFLRRTKNFPENEKKPQTNRITLTIPYTDSEKLFAICKEMCYNVDGAEYKKYSAAAYTIKKLNVGGALKPLFFLKNRLGLLFGTLIFIAFALFLNGRLLGVSLTGVPYEYRSAVSLSLKTNGITDFADISRVDLKELSETVLTDVKGLGFVTAKKRGSFLYLSAIKRTGEELNASVKPITSPVDGEILSINVLRGTGAKVAGDAIKKGDVLVNPNFTAGEQIFSVTPKAEIEIKTERVFTYNLSSDSETYVNAAKAVSLEKCRFSRVLDCIATSEESENGYKITVRIIYVYFIGGT